MTHNFNEKYGRDEGLTVLELIIVIAVVLIVTHVLLGAFSPNTPSDSGNNEAAGGFIGDFESSMENVLARNGPSYGMQDISGTLYDVDIYSYGVHPDELGSAAVSIKLVAMSGKSIDFNNADLRLLALNDQLRSGRNRYCSVAIDIVRSKNTALGKSDIFCRKR